MGNLHLNLDLAKLFGKLTHHFTSEKVGRQKPERARVALSESIMYKKRNKVDNIVTLQKIRRAVVD